GLEVGQKVENEVIAKRCWNAAGVKVKKGESYEITATGKWTDKTHESSASGYNSPNLIMKGLEKTKRVANAPWFCLIASVHPNQGLEFRYSDAAGMVTNFFDEVVSHAV